MGGTGFTAPVTSGDSGGANSVKIQMYCFSMDFLFIFDAKYDLTQFSDNFTVNTNKEQVYGRIDPLVNYSNTQRQISFAITFLEDAQHKSAIVDGKNLSILRGIASGLYPRYDTIGDDFNINVLKSPPLVAININGYVNGKFDANVDSSRIASTTNNKPNDSGKELLVGYLDSLSISYDVKSGLVAATSQNIQREYSANFSFTPIHDKEGGKKANGKPFATGWPWPK